ncbi:hypothetical protein [Streptomyces sp. NPDC002403]
MVNATTDERTEVWETYGPKGEISACPAAGTALRSPPPRRYPS